MKHDAVSKIDALDQRWCAFMTPTMLIFLSYVIPTVDKYYLCISKYGYYTTQRPVQRLATGRVYKQDASTSCSWSSRRFITMPRQSSLSSLSHQPRPSILPTLPSSVQRSHQSTAAFLTFPFERGRAFSAPGSRVHIALAIPRCHLHAKASHHLLEVEERSRKWHKMKPRLTSQLEC